MKVRGACLQVLTSDLSNLYTQELRSAVLRICLPLVLFPKSKPDMVIVRMILGSYLCLKEPLLTELVKKSGISLSDTAIESQEYSTRVWGVMSTVLASLDPQQHKKFWAHFTASATTCFDKNLEEHTLLSQFMMLVLLCFALEAERLAAPLRLQLAHILLDTCLSTFSNFTVSITCLSFLSIYSFDATFFVGPSAPKGMDMVKASNWIQSTSVLNFSPLCTLSLSFPT